MVSWPRLLALAQAEVLETQEQLPEDLRERAVALPITYQACPPPEMSDPDLLGLFVGESYAETGATSSPLPAQILLFLENIWELAGADPEMFAREVRVTYLHELGHYLGLDEDDLLDRGLD